MACLSSIIFVMLSLLKLNFASTFAVVLIYTCMMLRNSCIRKILFPCFYCFCSYNSFAILFVLYYKNFSSMISLGSTTHRLYHHTTPYTYITDKITYWKHELTVHYLKLVIYHQLQAVMIPSSLGASSSLSLHLPHLLTPPSKGPPKPITLQKDPANLPSSSYSQKTFWPTFVKIN